MAQIRCDLGQAMTPNPMPESVTDRPTSAHEYLFLLTKRPRYFYDCEAVREADKGTDHPRNVLHKPEPSGGIAPPNSGIRKPEGRNGSGRNRRTVWTVATAPYSGAHFATFPPKLIEPCILAGTSERGVCPECGGPWERVVDAKPSTEARKNHAGNHASKGGASRIGGFYDAESVTTGWRPSCSCGHETTVPATVLDPFGGTATTVKVANEHGRRGIALDLSAEYLGLARRRTSQTQVRFA